MIFEYLCYVVAGLSIAVLIQLTTMVLMSNKMNSGKFPVSAKQWNRFRRLTWLTLSTVIVLFVISIFTLTRY